MNLSKRSAAWDTGSKADPFRTARFRLALLYMGIIAAVVLVLSSALYEFHAHDVSGIERRRIVSVPEGERLGERDPGLGEYLESLGRSILFADLVTILVGERSAMCWPRGPSVPSRRPWRASRDSMRTRRTTCALPLR